MAELLKMMNLWASDLGVLFILAFAVLLVTQVVKQPIKLLFKKIIKNEKVLDRVCAIIILLPLGFGVLADYIMSLYTDLAFDILQGIVIGGVAVAMYALLEKLIKGNKSTATIATQELVDEITEDGKIDNKDKSAVREFLDKVKQ